MCDGISKLLSQANPIAKYYLGYLSRLYYLFILLFGLFGFWKEQIRKLVL